MRATARVAGILVALVVFMAFAVPAFAGHAHWLSTPGTCLSDIGSGQTSQTDGAGAHRLHANVHLGTPGTSAFGNTPVSVGKEGIGGC